MWNFDEPAGREGTDCIKYDRREETFGVKDIIPMWVADMDFNTPDFVVESLQKRLEHQIYGYSFRSSEYFQSMISWIKTRHNWTVEKEWISFSPGIVPALNFCTLAFICLKNNILIISYEIHCDLVLPGFTHTPMASLSEKIAENTVTLIAPSKTFNPVSYTH